jgi:hypothetical protein
MWNFQLLLEKISALKPTSRRWISLSDSLTYGGSFFKSAFRYFYAIKISMLVAAFSDSRKLLIGKAASVLGADCANCKEK